MKIGVFIFSTEYSIRMVDLARALEERGFESLFVPEHTHIPLSRRTPFPGGEPLPREYSNTLDPFVDLTAAAVVTRTLRIGTGICLVSQRDPIVTAKAVASLDLISEGRFEFGIGAGWNQDELQTTAPGMKTGFVSWSTELKPCRLSGPGKRLATMENLHISSLPGHGPNRCRNPILPSC